MSLVLDGFGSVNLWVSFAASKSMPRLRRLPKTQEATCTKRRRATVLAVDDNEADLKRARALLEALGMTVLTAASSTEALERVGSSRIDVALIDWRLKDQDDGMALGRGLWRQYHIPFVLFSAYLDPAATNRAHLLGAAYVVEKPLGPTTLQAALQVALRRGSRTAKAGATIPTVISCGSDSASQRWAGIILTACHAQKDPNTEAAMAKVNNISVSTYHRICDACDVSGNGTNDLARFLRALSRSREDGSMVRNHLCPMDARTRARLFQLAGLSTDSRFVELRPFLLNQKFISTDQECLRRLAHQLANDPLFFVEPDDTETGTGG